MFSPQHQSSNNLAKNYANNSRSSHVIEDFTVLSASKQPQVFCQIQQNPVSAIINNNPSGYTTPEYPISLPYSPAYSKQSSFSRDTVPHFLLNSSNPPSKTLSSRPTSAASKTNSLLSAANTAISSSSISKYSSFRGDSDPDLANPVTISNIRVVVRIRPKTDYEISRENSPNIAARSNIEKQKSMRDERNNSNPNKRQHLSTVGIVAPSAFSKDEKVAISSDSDGKTLYLLDQTTATTAFTSTSSSSRRTEMNNNNINHHNAKAITFHRVFHEDADQDSVFANSGVADLVSQAIRGYAATIFAFGQTGSGKTFTITGPELGWNEHPDRLGIIPRALQLLFQELDTLRSSSSPSPSRDQTETTNTKFTVHATYLEIYNELVQDLLSPLSSPTVAASSLPVRWTAEKGFYVENAICVECMDLDDCMAVLEEGLRNRTTGAHRLNEYSSRSHSIMTVYVESCNDASIDSCDVSQQQSRVLKTGKISFVDLAGSERVRESRAKGDTLTETMSINKSLLTLGNCISALSDPKKRAGHIPYRDSNLTKLLSDSLGGSGLALMIACISPSAVNLQESLKTLRYAARARRIRNRPSIHLIHPSDQRGVLALRREVHGLRRENAALRAAVEGRGSGIGRAFNGLYSPSAFTENPCSAATSVLRLPDIVLSSKGNLCASPTIPGDHRSSIRNMIPSLSSVNPPLAPAQATVLSSHLSYNITPSPYLAKFLRATSRTSDNQLSQLPPLAPLSNKFLTKIPSASQRLISADCAGKNAISSKKTNRGKCSGQIRFKRGLLNLES
ncbi:Kinesin- protein 12 [Physocladia obscura]|uniref:Kinesin-like protein n=1 Tax=Physocladia obscura TaxID=109957 RepID=A0AAD5XI74_9FUNG|nr:Kinesin- protein 12 [Physocladia obscura]